MGKSFMECGNAEKPAVFNLFYRKAPENNNWAVISGTDEVLEMISNLGSMPEDFFGKFLPALEIEPTFVEIHDFKHEDEA